MKKRETHHFTLLEVLIALTLLSVVAVLAMSSIQAARRLWIDMQDNSISFEELQNIDRIADTGFRNMIPFSWQDEDRKERLIFRGDPERILFAYLHRTTGKNSSAIRFLELTVSDQKLVARYRKTPLLYWKGEPQDSSCRREVIAKGVERMELEYADRIENEIVWTTDWDEDRAEQLPLAILLKVTFTDGREEQWLRRTAGSAYDTSLGQRSYKANDVQ